VHLGAGPDFKLDLYQLLTARKYVLVEADPEFAEEIQSHKPSENFEIIQGFVASETGRHTLYRYTLRSLTGPYPLGALQSFYPRLKEVRTSMMEAISLHQLLETLKLDNDGNHALFIDLPGQETNLLSKLKPDELTPFKLIMIKGVGEPHMDGAQQLEDALGILTESHWKIIRTDYHTDTLFPCVLLQQDARSSVIRDLRDELELRKNENDRLTGVAADAQAILESLRAETEQAKAIAADSELKRADLASQFDSLTKERDQARSEFASYQKIATDAQAALESLRAETEQAKAIAADSELKRADLTSQLASITQERDNNFKAYTDKKEEYEKSKKIAQERATHICELESQIAQLSERQRLFDEELSKTEAQLDMLKDLLRPDLM
jgi:hypothetical protein